MDSEEEFLVLACDGKLTHQSCHSSLGIWDCLSSQQVVDFVRRAVANGDDLGKICEDLMVKCLATDSETGGIGCDNMTVVVVALLNGRTPEEWKKWIKERVDNKGESRTLSLAVGVRCWKSTCSCSVGHDTPESIPDIFGQSQTSSIGGFGGGFGGGGFRVAGAGGLANIASILGASGITLAQHDSEDSDDDDDELHITGDEKTEGGKISALEESDEKTGEYIDDKGLNKDTKPKDVTDKLVG